MEVASMLWKDRVDRRLFDLDGVALPLKERVCSLGILLDPLPLLEAWVAFVVQSAIHQLWQVAQMHPCLDGDSLNSTIHTVVTSRLDYCYMLYMGLPLKSLQKLQLMQDSVARLFTRARQLKYTTSILALLYWPPISFWVQFNVLF